MTVGCLKASPYMRSGAATDQSPRQPAMISRGIARASSSRRPGRAVVSTEQVHGSCCALIDSSRSHTKSSGLLQ